MNTKEENFSGLKTMQLNDQKAGMQGLDKETINKIIYETSKGSSYFAFQEKRQKSIDQKVNELQLQMKNITESQRKDSLEKMDTLGKSLESKRDLSHSIVHIDMDAFYAAVEMLENPDLKDKPMAVGSMSMLSTSNYHARKYGVRAAMPGFIAKKLCPDLTIIPCNFEKYRAVSHKVRKIVEEYDPHYSSAGLDEVYLDLTEYVINKHKKHIHEKYCLKNNFSDSFKDEENDDCVYDNADCLECSTPPITSEERDKMAYNTVIEIRDRIFKTTQLTASAGIAPNTMLAKVCSDQNKPNGQYQIPSNVEAVKTFMASLPVKKVNGIGPVQGQILNAIGIHTCADMWSHRDLIANLFSPNSVEFYMRVALGIGSTTVRSDYVRKSIGNEQTFREIYKPEDLHKKCEELCDDLIEDLKSRNMVGKVLVLKIKTTGFKTFTRNHSLSYYTSDPEIIHSTAKKLLDAEIASSPVQPLKLRLMGVRMCNLVDETSIPNALKQQTTLKTFLQSKSSSNAESSSKSTETFTCPVCSKHYETSFSIFNDHVNSCISEENYTSENESEVQVSLLNSDVNANAMEETKANNCSVESSHSRISLKYFCPVCELNPDVKNLVELNAHIDNCLNKKEIRKILADDSQVDNKRKLQLFNGKEKFKKIKGSRKEKRIDEYFK